MVDELPEGARICKTCARAIASGMKVPRIRYGDVIRVGWLKDDLFYSTGRYGSMVSLKSGGSSGCIIVKPHLIEEIIDSGLDIEDAAEKYSEEKWENKRTSDPFGLSDWMDARYNRRYYRARMRRLEALNVDKDS
jgi:hypothetical protein